MQLRVIVWEFHHLSTSKILKLEMFVRSFFVPTPHDTFFAASSSYDYLMPVCAESKRIVEKNNEVLSMVHYSEAQLPRERIRYRPVYDAAYVGRHSFRRATTDMSIWRHRSPFSLTHQHYIQLFKGMIQRNGMCMSLENLILELSVWTQKFQGHKRELLEELAKFPRLRSIHFAVVSTPGEQEANCDALIHHQNQNTHVEFLKKSYLSKFPTVSLSRSSSNTFQMSPCTLLESWNDLDHYRKKSDLNTWANIIEELQCTLKREETGANTMDHNSWDKTICLCGRGGRVEADRGMGGE